jgi:hypothetical protein
MYFKTEILCKFLPAKPRAPDFKAYTCVINNPYLSIEIHLVMQIRITLIPLITYTPPNDLATHNNATFAKFKTCLLIQITGDSVNKYYNCSKSFFSMSS